MSYSVFDKKGGALKNIKFFDACVVYVANKLYEEFPRCVDINTEVSKGSQLLNLVLMTVISY